jgi:hypothetical protein
MPARPVPAPTAEALSADEGRAPSRRRIRRGLRRALWLICPLAVLAMPATLPVTGASFAGATADDGNTAG